MILLQSWRESLGLFWPSNYKLFMLTVLKSTIETCGYLAYYFWWLIVLFAISSIGYVTPEFLLSEHAYWLQYIVWAVEKLLWFFLLLLARPSVREKGPAYLKEAVKKNTLAFIAYLFFWNSMRNVYTLVLIQTAVGMSAVSLLARAGELLFYYVIYLHIAIPLLLMPSFIFSVLFFADSDGSIKSWFRSLWQAVKLVIYNLPFCIISLFIFVLFVEFGFRLLDIVVNAGVIKHLIFLVLQPLMVVYFKNFYIKRVHDNFSLYYPEA